ncbi:hypothetical protein HN51_019401 [Arachis hypogaea]|uniref:LysM domain-containing protein n=1 Tax=Arachis hypogaea TaxID=3818 RepID=A0A445BWR5_ARAHY|nr:Putative L,D-transpeptidase YkuD [Arachis hypogaea]RYR43163.1 hypothetical protein Ahy_A08g039595 [Arachis hypogaea]
MAKSTNISIALIFSLLVVTVFTAESRAAPTVAAPVCSSFHGVEIGETCDTIASRFEMSTADFLQLNPNINCNTMFVGQWVCVAGHTL